MVYLAWLVILLIPYWLGPIVVWLPQRAGARPAFEPFTLGRHAVPEDVAAAFRQTCDALSTEGFHVVADLFQTGQMKHVSTRVATGGRSRSTTVPFRGRSRRRRPASSCGCRSCGTRRGCAASSARTSSDITVAWSAPRSSTRASRPGSSGVPWCAS